MTIGIDGSRAFLLFRTGIEEYSYQITKALTHALPSDVSVRLYVRKKLRFQGGRFFWEVPEVDFPLPSHWELRALFAPRFWTQARLSLELLLHPIDRLFVPAHTIPLAHPSQSVVTIHGLEYEFYPESYGFFERLYMQLSIRFSVRVASTVIAVSQNTKNDLKGVYKVPGERIEVIGEGFENNVGGNKQAASTPGEYVLFVGRKEQRKNVIRVIEAFERWKAYAHDDLKLIVVGKAGYGYSKIHAKIKHSPYARAIEELGYVSDITRNTLFQNARAFLFPSLYEGFGLPILEAQSFGVPVVTSNSSSLPEVAGDGAILVDPCSTESIFSGLKRVLEMSNEEKEALIAKGRINKERFHWAEAGRKIADILA